MKPAGCAMTALVEARRDGRLAAPELASLERHLTACDACRALDDDLARLTSLVRTSDAETTPLAHRRARMRLLQVAAVMDAPEERGSLGGVAAPMLMRARPGWRVPLVAALAAMMLAGAGASQTRVSAAPPPRAVTPSTQSVQSVQSVQSAPEPEEAPAAMEPAPTTAATPSAALATVSATAAVPKLTPPRRVLPFPAALAAAPPEPPAPHGTPTPAVDFASSVGSMERGDYGEAAERLEAFQKAHPRDARTEDAAFLRILALDRAGKREDAAGAARAYLATYPDGYKRAQAEALARRGE